MKIATREIATLAVMTAFLLVSQVALSTVPGVEVVTVLLLCFCAVFGVLRGMAVATTFSLLRCLIWGFMPTAVILYLVYYNLFALVVGTTAKWAQKVKIGLQWVVFCAVAVVMTICFTLLDDLITPLFYGFTAAATRSYFFASLPVMLTQTICAAITVAAAWFPLVRVFWQIAPDKIKERSHRLACKTYHE